MIQKFLDGFKRNKRKIQKPFITKFKKIVFYSFFGFTTCLIISKKYNSELIYTFQANQQNFKLIKNVKVLDKAVYQPTVFLFFGFLQKIYAKYLQSSPYIKLQQKQQLGQIQYQIPLHHNNKNRKNVNLTLVIGGTQGLDNLMKNIMLCTYRNGFKTIGLVPKDIHDVQKLHQIVQSIKNSQHKNNPQLKIYGVGIQYGANLLVRYAAQHPQNIQSLVSIGNPLDLQKAEKQIQNSQMWKKLIYKQILDSRIKSIKSKFPQLNIPQNISLYNLDELVYQIQESDIQKWKSKNSSINYIKKLKMKSLFIQSLQDPFAISFQGQERLQNKNCIYIQTKKGGHHQWFQSNHLTRWICRPVSQYLKYLDQRNRQ